MTQSQDTVAQQYGNRLRVRVSGILIEDDKLLLVNHKNVRKSGDFWAPPGGGLDFGEKVEDCLKREFLEETGLTIQIAKFLCTYEFIAPPLHAIELFFEVKKISGQLVKGKDPEMREQIISEVAFRGSNDLKNLIDDQKHRILGGITTPMEILTRSGFHFCED